MKLKNLVLYLNDETGKYDLYVSDTQIVSVSELDSFMANEVLENIEPPIIESWMYVLRALIAPPTKIGDKLKATAMNDGE